MTLEEILPEIRKGRRWRVVGQEKWRGPVEKLPEGHNRALAISWLDLTEEFELEPERIELEHGAYATYIPDGFMVHASNDFDFFYVSNEEINILHAASLKARGLDKPQCSECNGTGTVMTQAGAGMYEFDCKKCAGELIDVDYEYVHPTTAEEAWEKYAYQEVISKSHTQYAILRKQFMDAFAIGQQSACPREVEYVPIKYAGADGTAFMYFKHNKDTYKAMEAAHRAGWDACLAQLGGKGV